ncbi:MAG: peroxiredoxin [Hyphomicrobiales bacterium]
MTNLQSLPDNLPRPRDDGAAAHLLGHDMPAVTLPSTGGRDVTLSELPGRTVVYAYPMTGQPDGTLPSDDWDMIPGARGCTPEACAFRDHHAELKALGADVFGLSTQTTAYQSEVVERLHLPFEILSDAEFALADALTLPTFEAGGMRLLKRHTMVIRDRRIEHVFYPVFPPDGHAEEVCAWLRDHPI